MSTNGSATSTGAPPASATWVSRLFSSKSRAMAVLNSSRPMSVAKRKTILMLPVSSMPKNPAV